MDDMDASRYKYFKNRIYYKNNKLKKKAKYLNNFFLSNLSSSKLLSPKNNTNENIPIKKLANKKICFYFSLHGSFKVYIYSIKKFY